MKTLNNYIHDIERFGYSPQKVYSRLFDDRSQLPKILSISVPKSGTNLVQRILTLHPQLYRRNVPTLGRRNKHRWKKWDKIFTRTKNGEIISSHFDYDIKLKKYLLGAVDHKLIFIARDPRDIVISDMYYILKRPDHSYHHILKNMSSEKERLSALITGTNGIRPIDKQIKRFLGWICPEILYMKFEEMVGEAGGGCDKQQYEAIQKIYKHLNIPIDQSTLQFIALNCRSSKSQTFRKGTIQNWKRQFDEDLKNDFKKVAGDLLIKMDYEKDINW